MRSAAHGLLFSRGRGGPAGPLCPLSVSQSVSQSRWQIVKSAFSRNLPARFGRTDAEARAKRTIFEVCKDPSQMPPKTLSLCEKRRFARPSSGNKVWGTCGQFNAKTGGTPLGGAAGAVQEGPGAAGRTEQDAFLAHPRQVRRLKIMK